MAITDFIEKVCVQDAVYWEYDGTDGYGSAKFKSPTDISVRWDEETKVVSDSEGREYISNAQLLIPQDVLEQSYVVLGTVAGLSETDPLKVDGAYEIKSVDRHPLFKSTTFDVFVAYL